MNKKIILLFICGLTLGVSCCKNDNTDDITSGSFYSKTFITSYAKLESVSKTSTSKQYIVFWMGGQNLYSGKEFDELCKRNIDTAYNDYWAGPRPAIADTLTGIKVETIEDFDETHKAGSDVSDLIECEYYTYDDFIRNGYKMLKSDGEKTFRSELRVFTSKLSEAEFYDSQITMPRFHINFTQQPEVKGKHTFKIIVTTTSKTIENTFDYEFE